MDDSEAAEEDPARGRRGGSGLRFPPVIEGIQRGARGGHLHKRLAAVLRLQVNAATAVDDDIDHIAQRQGIQHGEFDAVIGGEAEDGQFHDALAAQPAVQFSFLPVTVVKKAL